MKKRIIILGCTGSIGTTAVEIVRELPQHFEISGISAHKNEEILLRLAREFSITHTALTDNVSAPHECIRYTGVQGLCRMIREVDADMVLNGISGASGLAYSIEALRSGKDLALANKESAVLAGKLLFDLAGERGCSIVPVDSEHSAILQLLRHRPIETVERVVLTASGGPFRTLPTEQFTSITLEQALRHPTWDMGPKITIDSSTLANKGLEVIETSHFFGFPPDAISVMIHPQSLVHSLIETREGSLYGQMSQTSMKLPILNALSYPEIIKYTCEPFTLVGKTLTFEQPDYQRFPMLSYAFDALRCGPASPIVYNAANEVAVEGFLNGTIHFTEISHVVHEVLSREWDQKIDSFDAVYETDRRARSIAETLQRSL